VRVGYVVITAMLDPGRDGINVTKEIHRRQGNACLQTRDLHAGVVVAGAF
jgi:hypothetical protein